MKQQKQKSAPAVRGRFLIAESKTNSKRKKKHAYTRRDMRVQIETL
jgi:hypothetical protein